MHSNIISARGTILCCRSLEDTRLTKQKLYCLPVGNHSKSGKCGSAPTWKSQWGVRLLAGPTTMDRLPSGKSGLHCT